MFCTECGSSIDDNAKFCTVCGATVPEQSKKRKHIALACGGLVAVLVLGIGGFFVSKAFLPSIFGFVFVNQAAFPDESLRSIVAEQIDTDHNGIITPGENAAVTQLDFTALQNMTYTPPPVSSPEDIPTSIVVEGDPTAEKDLDATARDIISLEGLRYLFHLQSLNCANMGLTALDLSGCPTLIYVDCRDNNFSALNLAKNKALSCLYCDDNVHIGGLDEAGLVSDDLLTYAELTGETYDTSGSASDRATLEVSYDMQGRMVSSIRPDKTCFYRYNEKSNLVEVGTDATSNARMFEYTDTYAYTDEGLPLSSARHAITSRFDGPLHVMEPYEYTSQFTYDAQGRLTGENTMVPSRFEDHAIVNKTATYSYLGETNFPETSNVTSTFSGDVYEDTPDPRIVSEQYSYNDAGSLSTVRSNVSVRDESTIYQTTCYIDGSGVAISNGYSTDASERLAEYTSYDKLGFPVETSGSETDLKKITYSCNMDGYITDAAWSFSNISTPQNRTLKMNYVKHVGGASYKSIQGTLPQFIFSSMYQYSGNTHLSNLLWQPSNGTWFFASIIEVDPLMKIKEAHHLLNGTIRSGSRVAVDESGSVIAGNWPWKDTATWIPNVPDEELAQLVSQDATALSNLQDARVEGTSGDTTDGTSVQLKTSLPEYSWDELSSISRQVETCANTTEAFEIAKKYNLVDAKGKATGAVKTFTLSDGTTLEAQVVGILQDDKADGTGKAGLSFITKECYANHRMNAIETNSGGWRDSEMRAWLNSDVLDWFPDEIKSRIVEVKKLTNNVGRTETTDSVSETTDKIWLFSWTEMFGSITWNKSSDQTYIDTVLSAEGTQYQLFADYGLADSQSSDTKGILAKHVVSDPSKPLSNWWVRSPTPNRTDGFGDVNNGATDNGGLATASQGVVFGFCL